MASEAASGIRRTRVQALPGRRRLHFYPEQAMCAQSTHMTSREGNRQRETKVTYDAAKRASYLERDRVKNTVVLAKEIDIPACVHDVVGGLFFCAG